MSSFFLVFDYFTDFMSEKITLSIKKIGWISKNIKRRIFTYQVSFFFVNLIKIDYNMFQLTKNQGGQYRYDSYKKKNHLCLYFSPQ